jgi:hypothetical protein
MLSGLRQLRGELRMILKRLTAALVLAVLTVAPRSIMAVQPAERLLPATTKGFISTQDYEELLNKFNETQFGALSHDPSMQPFIDDLKQQIRAKLEKAGKKIGLTWKDVEGVYGGEVAAALIQPDSQDKMSHATAIIVDITGKKKEADALLKKIEANQMANKAKRTTLNEAGIEITQYEQPLQKGEKQPQRSYLLIANDQLITTDHAPTMRGIVKRLDGKVNDSLASVAGFNESLKHCAAAANGVRYHVRWFVEPLGYAETSRAIQGGKKSRGVDQLQVLQTQGFNAIQGVGGYVYFATNAGGLVPDDRPEILHRTYVYAPAVKRNPNDRSKDKYDLAMRMLDFPNSTTPDALNPQSWALPDVAAYLSFNWKMRQAFDYSETLFDALMDDKGAFKEMWSAKKSGAESAPIDIYADLLDHIGTRATLLSDVKVPVDLKSERQLALIELKTPDHTAAVAKTLEKNFKANERARKLPLQDPVIWEVEQAPQDDEPPAKGKAKSKAKAKAAQPQAPRRRTAFTAYRGHLIISTHANFIEEFVSRQGQTAGLAKEIDHSRVRAALTALGSQNDSFRYFNRTEESYQANYELFKQGKLPASETLLAGLLNALLTSGSDKSTRKPEFDGSKLPEFDSIKKYLGPGGLYAQSEDDGWWLVGCLLKKH